MQTLWFCVPNFEMSVRRIHLVGDKKTGKTRAVRKVSGKYMSSREYKSYTKRAMKERVSDTDIIHYHNGLYVSTLIKNTTRITRRGYILEIIDYPGFSSNSILVDYSKNDLVVCSSMNVEPTGSYFSPFKQLNGDKLENIIDKYLDRIEKKSL